MLDRHKRLRILLSPVEALLSSVFLREVKDGSAGHRMAAFMCLRKP
jgi:hypothetical protein